MPHSCPECRGPAQHMLNHVLCVNSSCPNYDEETALDFNVRFPSIDEPYFDPWDDISTLKIVKF